MQIGGKSISKPTRIPSLDGLRAVAILIVFIGHAGLPQLLRDMTGVTIFFFLSGYLITTRLARERNSKGSVNLLTFYKRRAFRILPAMYVVLALAIAISALGILPSTMTPLGAVISSLQFTNYWIILDGREQLPAAMNALWSLNVEEHFYFLFPLLFVAFSRWLSRRQQLIVLGVMLAAFLIWRVTLASEFGAGFDRLYLATDTRADSILWGCLLAIGWNPATGRGFRGASRFAWVYFSVGVALMFAARVMPQMLSVTLGFTVEAVALMLIFTAVISAPETLFGRVLNWRPVAYLGTLSYALYLVHRPVLLLVEEYVPAPTVVIAVIAFIVALLASYLTFRFIETPMIEFGKRISWGSRRTRRSLVQPKTKQHA